jgi:hypothetical protein
MLIDQNRRRVARQVCPFHAFSLHDLTLPAETG